MSTTPTPEAAVESPPDEEAPLDPQRAIVDAHHHLWDVASVPGFIPRRICFLLPEILETIARSGHNVTHTVFIEGQQMYRADGPPELRPVGETEFANGVAAMCASGRYGAIRVAAGIIGSADLRLGDRVKGVLEAHIAAGNGRLRGVRMRTDYSDAALFGFAPDPSFKGLLLDAGVRKGVAALEPHGLSLDVWCVHTQIPELTDIATAFPRTSFILDHLGSPLNIGPYAGREKEVFAIWKKAITDLARRPNVTVKLGGFAQDLSIPVPVRPGNAASASLTEKWRPYFDTCIAAFGPERCMFESNFPPDSAGCTYGALWNAFKLIASGYSEAEKTAMFSGTAKRIYRLN